MTARGIWLAYILLLGLSIPWYVPAGSAEPVIAGFPLWCLVSLGCYVTAALLTVWRMDTLWKEQSSDADSRRERHRPERFGVDQIRQGGR